MSDGASLPNPQQLFVESFDLYKKRFLTIAGVIAAPIILSAISLWIVEEPSVPGGIAFTIALIGWFLSIWSQVAMIMAVKNEKLNVLESYKESTKFIASYFWLAILTSFIVAGGFVLFIIPGIILAFSFSLAIYVMLNEDAKGFDALVRSRAYVTTPGAKVFRHFAFIVLLTFAMAAVVGLLSGSTTTEPEGSPLAIVQNLILGITVVPFVTIYMFKLYNHLHSINNQSHLKAAPKTKVLYGVLAILGPIASVVLIGWFMSLFINTGAGTMLGG